MDREKQIEEKHELSESIYMSGHGLDWKDSDDIAEQLYSAGYRKQSEVAMEIIGEILSSHTLDIDGFFTMHESELTELKKKYTEESGNDR